MRVLLTGSGGQLGQAFENIFLENDVDYVALHKTELDISSQDGISSIISSIRPNVVINTAAFTNVDLAETQSKIAFSINRDGPMLIAKSCNELDITLIHFSSDYVFDGLKKSSYMPSDFTNPINEYGKSKLAGEIEIQKNCSNYLIFRSSWLFSEYKKNFLKTILNSSNSKQEISIIYDQLGSPTSASDLAMAIHLILPRLKNKDFISGIYHFAGQQIFSWDEFASEIFAQAIKINLIKNIPAIKKISSTEYNSAAPRPLFSALDSSDFLTEFNINPSNTFEAIGKVLTTLKHTKSW